MGDGNTGLPQHLQSEVLADQQVTPPVRRRAVAAGKLHQQVTAFGIDGELGMLAAGRRAWLTGQHACGEAWVVRPGVWLRLPREEAVERLLPDDQVADAVLARIASAIS